MQAPVRGVKMACASIPGLIHALLRHGSLPRWQRKESLVCSSLPLSTLAGYVESVYQQHRARMNGVEHGMSGMLPMMVTCMAAGWSGRASSTSSCLPTARGLSVASCAPTLAQTRLCRCVVTRQAHKLTDKSNVLRRLPQEQGWAEAQKPGKEHWQHKAGECRDERLPGQRAWGHRRKMTDFIV